MTSIYITMMSSTIIIPLLLMFIILLMNLSCYQTVIATDNNSIECNKENAIQIADKFAANRGLTLVNKIRTFDETDTSYFARYYPKALYIEGGELTLHVRKADCKITEFKLWQ